MSLKLTSDQKEFLATELNLTFGEINNDCNHNVDYIAQSTMDLLAAIVECEDEHGNYDRLKAIKVEEIMSLALGVVMVQEATLLQAI